MICPSTSIAFFLFLERSVLLYQFPSRNVPCLSPPLPHSCHHFHHLHHFPHANLPFLSLCPALHRLLDSDGDFHCVHLHQHHLPEYYKYNNFLKFIANIYKVLSLFVIYISDKSLSLNVNIICLDGSPLTSVLNQDLYFVIPSSPPAFQV